MGRGYPAVPHGTPRRHYATSAGAHEQVGAGSSFAALELRLSCRSEQGCVGRAHVDVDVENRHDGGTDLPCAFLTEQTLVRRWCYFRYGRTKHCPFGASRRKDYSHAIDASKNGPDDVMRWKRHGYGSTKQSEAETPLVMNTVLQKWADPNLVRMPTAQARV